MKQLQKIFQKVVFGLMQAKVYQSREVDIFGFLLMELELMIRFSKLVTFLHQIITDGSTFFKILIKKINLKI